MTTAEATCDDCGARIERVPGTMPRRWGERVERADAWAPVGKATCVHWDMACRITYDPRDTSRILAADFHHVAGERQRHFRAADL